MNLFWGGVETFAFLAAHWLAGQSLLVRALLGPKVQACVDAFFGVYLQVRAMVLLLTRYPRCKPGLPLRFCLTACTWHFMYLGTPLKHPVLPENRMLLCAEA